MSNVVQSNWLGIKKLKLGLSFIVVCGILQNAMLRPN